MWTVTVSKTFEDDIDGVMYIQSFSAETQTVAVHLACNYASMVEYGYVALKWGPKDMPFSRDMLKAFIQSAQLDVIEQMYPDIITVSYENALAYVQSYVGAMFDIDAMLSSGDASSTAQTLRLALMLCTVTYILASTPQYAETVEMHNRQLHHLLKGLKSGSRNFGKAAIAGDPNVRVSIVDLIKTGEQP